MGESVFQQVRRVLSQEHGVGHAWFRALSRVKQRRLDNIHFNELEHAREQHALQFEPALVISIGENEEDILYDAQEVLLEECIRDGRFGCRSKVVHNFQAN